MSRVAAIDVGTNSVLLTVVDSGAPETAVFERATITRLGEGVDASGCLTTAAVERTLACLTDYATDVVRLRVQSLAVVGTSALRDAGGGPELCDAAERLLGVRPRVLSGKEEAELAFGGALSGLRVTGPVLVFDLGGGSTEIIQADPARAHVESWSLDIGSVRLHERHVRGDPPDLAGLEALRQDARTALATVAPREGATLLGVAGTVTTLAAMNAGLRRFDADAIHGAVLARQDVQALAARLAALEEPARRRLRGLDPRRADVIVSGALIALEIMIWSGAPELVVSSRGVRWGVVEQLLRRAAPR